MNKQIVVSEEILYLRQLCDKIKVKCIAGYFKHATERDALIYENIIKISFKLLESVAGKKDETLFEPEDYGGNDSEQKYGWKRNRGLYRKSSNIGTGAEQWSEKEINWACERAYYHSWRLDGNKFVKYDVFDIMPKNPVYIDFGQSAVFLEWGEDENPYRDLQAASSYCEQRQQPGFSIIAKIFNEILNLLEENAPLVKIVRLLEKFSGGG